MSSDIDHKLKVLIEEERSQHRPLGITVLVLLDFLFASQELFIGIFKTWPTLITNSTIASILGKFPIPNYLSFLYFILYLIAGISLWKKQNWSRYFHLLMFGNSLFGSSAINLNLVYGLIVIFILFRLDNHTKAYFKIKQSR